MSYNRTRLKINYQKNKKTEILKMNIKLYKKFS